MKAHSIEAPRPARCSVCSSEFLWSAAQLYPLMCGHVICRTCLVQYVQAALSSRKAPAQCCNKAIPHDFVHDVVAPAENVYYSFLLNQPHGGNNMKNMTGSQTKIASKFDVADGNMLSTINGDKLKRPAISLDDSSAPAQASTGAPSLGQATSTATSLLVQPPQPRYLTRSARARNAAEQDSKQSGGLLLSGQPDMFCENCGIVVDASTFKAPCGHDLCRNCVENGVRRYLNSAPNSDAIPASCCGELLPLELVRRVVSGRELLIYARLEAKHASAATDSTLARTRGTKRKERKATPATRKEKDKAPAKRAKTANDLEQGSERTCTACFSTVPQLGKWRVGPCGHGYCLSCLAKMAKTSLTNRDKVPVRCCAKEFPVEYVERPLTKRQFEKYSRFLAERDPSASTLQSDKDYAAVVRQSKGKQCPVCGIGVIKISGCHAMQCSLGHSFCWNCMQTRCTCGGIYQNN